MYFYKKTEGDFSRHFLVLVVVMTAVFLLVLGYDEQQVAPAFGLLGTILGYIFGKAASGADEKGDEKKADSNSASRRDPKLDMG
jgi:hypothetical protein